MSQTENDGGKAVPEQKTYPTIVADPPWLYGNFGAKKHGAARGHYPGTTGKGIAEIPVAKWARADSLLLLWATLPKLDEAVDVMRAWGFSLITAIPWVKTHPASEEIRRGIGFWFYSTSELLLICRKGKAKAPKQSGAEKQMGLLASWDLQAPDRSPVFYAPRAAHSRKPLSLTEWIESKLPGPYLELFARVDRPGWTCLGHDTGWHLDKRGATRVVRTGL